MKRIIALLLCLSSLSASGQIDDFKTKVDTSITNKTGAASITKSAVGGRLKDLADIVADKVDTIYRKPGTDSIFLKINGVTYYVFKDSIGGGSSAWADLTGKPTTISGYGITDAGLPDVTGRNDSTSGRIKIKRLMVGLGPGFSSRDTNGIILHGWTDLYSFVYGNGQGVYGQVVGVDSSTTTISGTAASVGLWNSGGTATVAGFRASASGVLWKSAVYGLGPNLSVSGIGASFSGYIAQTHPSWTKATTVSITGSGARVYGLYQGSVDVLLNDGAGFASCDCRDSGKLRVTENGAAFIGGIEQGAEAWSNGGGTMLGGLFNKGYAFSGRGIKDKFTSARTDHATFVWATNYWVSDVVGAYGDGSSLHGIATEDSCVAMGDTNTHVMGSNVKVYGSHAFGFGRNFRTTRRDLFTVGFGSVDFQIDGWDKRVRVKNNTDSLAEMAEVRALVNAVPLPDVNCDSIVLVIDTLPVTCRDQSDGLMFIYDALRDGGYGRAIDRYNIFIDGVEYINDPDTCNTSCPTYGPGRHTIYAELKVNPSCSKTYFHTFWNPPPVASKVWTCDASELINDGAIIVIGTPGSTIFVDGFNTTPGYHAVYDTGYHEVLVTVMNQQFSGLCTDTTEVYVGLKDGRMAPQIIKNYEEVHHELVLSDRGALLEMESATARTLTIPLNATTAFPIGTRIEVIQDRSGQITISPAGGVLLRSEGGKDKTRAQYSHCTLIKRDTDEWYLFGDIDL